MGRVRGFSYRQNRPVFLDGGIMCNRHCLTCVLAGALGFRPSQLSMVASASSIRISPSSFDWCHILACSTIIHL
ncbi:hypothetical protein FRX31_016772 [Thalictrum thalictroides]|uniref:Uncharacterized protein n=1 Tax=Thalictrum thalictroides TaxID=46969 RepID=A0A7J6W8P7_THATH|nr:hypothetical protein FRX31_016772 [Thalictrum thalictroides]